MTKSSHLNSQRTAPSRRVRTFLALLILGLLGWGGWEFQRRLDGQWTGPGDWWGIRATKSQYGEDVAKYAEEFDLPYAYLMALIQLESGGRKPAGKRFEPHVFEQLKAVRDGTRPAYENVTSLPGHISTPQLFLHCACMMFDISGALPLDIDYNKQTYETPLILSHLITGASLSPFGNVCGNHDA